LFKILFQDYLKHSESTALCLTPTLPVYNAHLSLYISHAEQSSNSVCIIITTDIYKSGNKLAHSVLTYCSVKMST